jgi:hypothetical protein
MLNDFELLPGEHLASAVARWHIMSVSLTFGFSMKRLGLPIMSVIPLRIFHAGDTGIGVLDELHNTATCWYQHAFGNYIWPFLNRNEQDVIQQELKSQIPNKLPIHGFRASSVSYWRWCSECIEQDESEHGIAYFHQNHQLPGVFHCYRHGGGLSGMCIHCGFHIKSINSSVFLLPYNNLCPECGRWMQGYDGYFSEKMQEIQKISLCLSQKKHFFSLEEITQLQNKDVQFFKHGWHLSGSLKEKNAWHRSFSEQFDKQALACYFKEPNLKNGQSIFPIMRKSRIWNSKINQGPLNPLVHLIALQHNGINLLDSLS